MEEGVLYFDIINGISGGYDYNTILDLGILKMFFRRSNKLNLNDEFKINIEQKNESGIVGTKVDDNKRS